MTNAGSNETTLSLVAFRIFYGITWFSFPTIYSFIALDLGFGITGLATATTSFLLGMAIFQIPGGIFSARHGARNVLLIGTLTAATGTILCGLTTDLGSQVLLRFVVGAGMGLTFSPSVRLIAKHYRTGSEGMSLGIFGAALGLGGFLALVFWGLLAESTSWRVGLFVNGLLGLGCIVLMMRFIPKQEDEDDGLILRFRTPALFVILRDRRLNLISLCLLGTTIGPILVGNIMTYYLENVLDISPSLSGSIASLSPILSVVSSLIFGKLYDKVKDVRRLLLICGAGSSLSLTLSSAPNLYMLSMSSALVGFFQGGGFTTAIASAREISSVSSRYDTVRVGWVNSFSLVGNFWIPIVFAYTVSNYGYPFAWICNGFFVIVFVLPVMFLPE
ncbi:MAG TPA: MFS transporter [Nitrososphaerales archaeon]|nr:MFS transporter [Nitrososphaerales archaeon]